MLHIDTDSPYGILAVEVIRKNVKNLNLRIRSDGTPVVSAPFFTPEKRIETFVRSNVAWLVRHLEKRENYFDKEEQKKIVHQEKVEYSGKSYTVVFLEGKPKVDLVGDYIAIFSMGNHEKTLEKWWRKEAKRIFTEDMDKLYEKYFLPLGVKKPRMSVRRMTSRWGSCNHAEGKITMNDNLIKGPRECVEYVVLHELTHLLYPNHGESFHAFIAARMPDWKERDKKLKAINKK